MCDDKKPTLEAIKYQRGGPLMVLDQLSLPIEHKYSQITSCTQGWTAIHDMHVRGAPAIALTGLLSLAIELHSDNGIKQGSKQDMVSFVRAKLEYLVTSRPTGVNLRIEAENLIRLANSLSTNDSVTSEEMVESIVNHCEEVFRKDVQDNMSIGRFGSEHILDHNVHTNEKVSVITHCNTGALATGGYGTALGVIRALHDLGYLKKVYFTETRPYNQGSRLTAYELVYENIPSTLICDSAVSALMSKEEISAVVVGADRIAANGDTANKIGTLQLAIVAKHYKVPFYVAAPTSTIDLSIASGNDITIENRPDDEITLCKCPNKVRIPPEGVICWNPAFDVTPANLITGGIITQHGLILPPVNSTENLSKLHM